MLLLCPSKTASNTNSWLLIFRRSRRMTHLCMPSHYSCHFPNYLILAAVRLEVMGFTVVGVGPVFGFAVQVGFMECLASF
jgi:hypothetical protein